MAPDPLLTLTYTMSSRIQVTSENKSETAALYLLPRWVQFLRQILMEQGCMPGAGNAEECIVSSWQPLGKKGRGYLHCQDSDSELHT